MLRVCADVQVGLTRGARSWDTGSGPEVAFNELSGAIGATAEGRRTMEPSSPGHDTGRPKPRPAHVRKPLTAPRS